MFKNWYDFFIQWGIQKSKDRLLVSFQIGLVHCEDLKIQNSRAVIKWGQTHKNVWRLNPVRVYLQVPGWELTMTPGRELRLKKALQKQSGVDY